MEIFVQTSSPRWPTMKQVANDRQRTGVGRSRQSMLATNEITNEMAVRMAR